MQVTMEGCRTHLIENWTTSDVVSQMSHLRVIYCILHVNANQKLESGAKLMFYFCKSDHLLLSIIPYLKGLLMTKSLSNGMPSQLPLTL